MQQLLMSLGPSLVTAFVTSWLTVRLSLKKFHSERWWERKAEAYSKIIEAFHDLLSYYNALAEDYLTENGVPQQRFDELKARYESARSDVDRATSIGAYIISNEASEALTRYSKRPRLKWRDNAPFDFYDNEAVHCRTTLDRLRQLAKKDLKVA
jgi:hypothetical protein